MLPWRTFGVVPTYLAIHQTALLVVTLFVGVMLRHMLEKGADTWHGRLMMREMAEPTEYTDEHVERFVRPAMTILEAILDDWFGDADVSAERRLRLVQSIVGQVLFFFHGRQVMSRLEPGLAWDAAEADRATEHIVAFSSFGIEAARRGELA